MAKGPPTTEGRILCYSPEARLSLRVAVAAGVAGTVLVIGQAWLLSQVVARVFLGGEGLAATTPLLLAMLLLACGRAVFGWAGEVMGQRTGGQLSLRLLSDLTGHLRELGPWFSLREQSGELVNAATGGMEEAGDYLAVYQPLRLLAGIVPLVVATVVLLIDPFSVLMLVVTGPVLVLLLALIGSRTTEVTRRRSLELGLMSGLLLDLLQGLPDLKMFGRSREQVDNLREAGRRYADTTMGVLRTAFGNSFVLELGSSIAVALVAVEVSLRLVDGSLAFSRALAVLVITPEFFRPLRQLSGVYHVGSSGRAAAERIFQVLDTPCPPQPGHLPQVLDGPLDESARRKGANYRRPLPALPAEIVFEDVSFAYEGGERPALHGIHLTIPLNGTVALVGETGAGKSTLAGLLLGFIRPDSGRIRVDGVPLEEPDQATWRRSIAWVPQHPYLFQGTILDNIRLARAGATRDEVVAAAMAASAHEFIEGLRDGYDTIVGENGAHLSGGEGQRIAIARAFLKRAPFLVLDEPASHLDGVNESMLVEALRRLLTYRGGLIITHSANLCGLADQVVALERGRVVEDLGCDLRLASAERRQLLALRAMGVV